MKNTKSLIAYFSHSGNTEVVAEKLQKMTSGDMFYIQSSSPYSTDYSECIKQAKSELHNNAHPQLTNTIDNIDKYDVVYLGYPNWWGTIPMAVFTFLESYDFTGKTIMPYCTHEGSAMGVSERDIKKLCPNSTVLSGLAIRGSSVSGSDKTLSTWISN